MASESFDRGARSCEQTLLEISTAPMLSGCQQSRCIDIAQAIDWLIRLLHWYVGGMRSTHFAGYAEVDIASS